MSGGTFCTGGQSALPHRTFFPRHSCPPPPPPPLVGRSPTFAYWVSSLYLDLYLSDSVCGLYYNHIQPTYAIRCMGTNPGIPDLPVVSCIPRRINGLYVWRKWVEFRSTATEFCRYQSDAGSHVTLPQSCDIGHKWCYNHIPNN